MTLLDRVRRTIRQHDLARPDTRVVVALSGGPDSVALAHLLRDLDAAADLRVAGLAHFNHQLRAAALDDERFSVDLAASFGWPILVGREDVAARAQRDGRSLEDAARTARHAFLERARRHFSADRIALGHTRDDQAETFLLRLVRGAGPRGLAAMHPQRGAVIRPLLDCRRADLRAFLDSQGIAYVRDESNDDVSIPRNRVRAELLPLLERRFNPSIVDALADQADIAREDWQWMEQQREALARGVCHHDGSAWRIDADALANAPTALARLVVRSAMVEAGGGRPIAFTHVERVLRLIQGDGPAIDVPGQHVERIGSFVVLTSRTAEDKRRGHDRAPEPFCYPLPIPGVVELRESGGTLSAEEAASAGAAGNGSGGYASGDGQVAVLGRGSCRPPFYVRNRRPGDRFRPLGLEGSKKLQDYLVDKKVDRRRRDEVPLVVDESGRIVWVAGHAIDHEFRVTDPSEAVLILRFKVLGGSA